MKNTKNIYEITKNENGVEKIIKIRKEKDINDNAKLYKKHGFDSLSKNQKWS